MPVSEVELVAHPFFRGITESQIATLVACTATRQINRDCYVFREGEDATHLYLITAGRIELANFVPGHGDVPVATLQAGDALGWSWLFPPYRWQFDARAVEPVTVISLDADVVRARCDADDTLGYRIVWRVAEALARLLQTTQMRMLDVIHAQPVGRAHRE